MRQTRRALVGRKTRRRFRTLKGGMKRKFGNVTGPVATQGPAIHQHVESGAAPLSNNERGIRNKREKLRMAAEKRKAEANAAKAAGLPPPI